MRNLRYTIQSLLIITLVLALPALTRAQSYRTWVSGSGDDADPCSRSAPCKTFGVAISKTNVNGEINCIDPGGYGVLTITKSITIDCRSTLGSILASNGTGIFIKINTTTTNDPLATVRLRGLEINGTGSCGTNCGYRTGIWGIHVTPASTRRVKLFVEDLYIHGFLNGGIVHNGPGGDLSVSNCSIIDNGGNGIFATSSASGSNGIIHVTVDGTTTNLNDQGISFDSNSFGVVKNSTASNNLTNGYAVTPFGQNGNAEMTLMDSIANNNKSFGVVAAGRGSFVGTARIVNLTAIHNTFQLGIVAGGTICTNQKNHIGTPSDAPSPCFLDQ
jgi:hypothetical protein